MSPRPLHPVRRDRRPERCDGLGERDPPRVRAVRHPRDVGRSRAGTFPQVPIDDPKMYPIYATCVELGIPIFVCAGVPGPRIPMAPQEVERIDERDVRLPRAGVRHPPRLRTVGGPRGQADAEVAEPVLLDIGVRAQVLPEGDHRLRQHARRRQGHLRRLLPDGPVARAHLQRHAQRRRSRTRCGRSSCTATPHASSAWRADGRWRWRSRPSRSNSSTPSVGSPTRHAPIDKTRAIVRFHRGRRIAALVGGIRRTRLSRCAPAGAVRRPGRQPRRYGLRDRGRRCGAAARPAAEHGDRKRRGESG